MHILHLWDILLDPILEDPDEVQSTPSSYANAQAVVNWKGKEAPIVNEVAIRLWQYEESLFSSLVSAVEKLDKQL